MRRRIIEGALAGTLCLSGTAQAQGRHPDFSGTWVLDTARSEQSSFTPAGATYRIVQHGDTLRVERTIQSTTGDTLASTMLWGMDGRPWPFTLRLVGQETEASAVLTWAGDTLTIVATSHPGGSDLVQTDRWHLEGGGARLVMRRGAVYGGESIGSPTWVFFRSR